MSISSSTINNTRQKYKLVFLGGQSVGKSSIIERYINDTFDQSLNPTVGIDFYTKNVMRNNNQYRLQLWDTAGQQRFRSLIPSYMKDADCAIFVYDVTNEKSIKDLIVWNSMFQQYKQISAVKAVVGNKTDLASDRVIQRTDGENFAKQIGAKYFQVSAKTGKKLSEMFLLIIDLIIVNNEERSRLVPSNDNQQVASEEVKTQQKKNDKNDKRLSTKTLQKKFSLKKDEISSKGDFSKVKKKKKCCTE